MKIEGYFETEKPDGYKWLNAKLTVAGIQFYLDQINAVLKSSPEILDFYPALEPDNPYDANAIALYLSTSAGDIHVGYVDAETAQEIADSGFAPVMKVFLGHIKILDDAGWIDYSIAVPKSIPKARALKLIQCHDCNNKVSRRAASCPKCGAPVSADDLPPPSIKPVEQPAQWDKQVQKIRKRSYYLHKKTEVNKSPGCLIYAGLLILTIGLIVILVAFVGDKDNRIPLFSIGIAMIIAGVSMFAIHEKM